MSSVPHQCLAVSPGSITRRRILEGLAAAAALAALPFKLESRTGVQADLAEPIHVRGA